MNLVCAASETSQSSNRLINRNNFVNELRIEVQKGFSKSDHFPSVLKQTCFDFHAKNSEILKILEVRGDTICDKASMIFWGSPQAQQCSVYFKRSDRGIKSLRVLTTSCPQNLHNMSENSQRNGGTIPSHKRCIQTLFFHYPTFEFNSRADKRKQNMETVRTYFSIWDKF